MSRTVRGSLGSSSRMAPVDDDEISESRGEKSSGRKSRKNVERKPTFLSFFKVHTKLPRSPKKAPQDKMFSRNLFSIFGKFRELLMVPSKI